MILDLIEKISSDIFIDLNDLNKILSYKGYAYINEKKGSIDETFIKIFNNTTLNNPKGILIYIVHNKYCDMDNISILLENYLENFMDNPNIDYIEGYYCDESFKNDEILLGCIITGIEID